MRISDWSSDVCSSDLLQLVFGRFILVVACCEERRRTGGENEGVHIWFRDRHYGLLAIRPGETLRSAAGCARAAQLAMAISDRQRDRPVNPSPWFADP